MLGQLFMAVGAYSTYRAYQYDKVAYLSKMLIESNGFDPLDFDSVLDFKAFSQYSMRQLGGAFDLLELLNDGVLFSDTVHELKQSLLDGILKPSETALSIKKAEEVAKKAAEEAAARLAGTASVAAEQDTSQKAQILNIIHSLARYTAEILEAHHWNPRIRAHLIDDLQSTGEPFLVRPGDGTQILQIKKTMNALYHLEQGLLAIESGDLKDILQYLVSVQNTSTPEVPTENPASEAPEASEATNTWSDMLYANANPLNWAPSTWADKSSSWVDAGYQAYVREVKIPYTDVSYKKESGLSYKDLSLQGLSRESVMFHGVPVDNILDKAIKGIHHIHRACDLLTHIEPDFLSAFHPEWAYVKNQLDTHGFTTNSAEDGAAEDGAAEDSAADSAEATKAEVPNSRAKKISDFIKKMGFLSGVLLDQLRPGQAGGADYSLLAQLASGLATTAHEKTAHIQENLLDAEQIFKKLKAVLLSHGVNSETLDKAKEVIEKEYDAQPRAKKKLKELHATVNKLQREFNRLNGDNGFLSLDIISNISIAWHAWSLLTELLKELDHLSESSKTVIHDLIVELRDEYLAYVIGLVDKLEEVTLSEAGTFTGPIMKFLETYYQKMIEKGSAVLNQEALGPLQSEAFKLKRMTMAKARRVDYQDELRAVDELLLPAVESLANPSPSVLEQQKMASFYQLLQPHLEILDAARSNELILAWQAKANATPPESPYPVISPITDGALLGQLRGRLVRLKSTKALSIGLVNDLIQSLPQTPDIEDVITVLTPEARVAALPDCSVLDLHCASARKVQGYLVEDITEKSSVKVVSQWLDTGSKLVTGVLDKRVQRDEKWGRYLEPGSAYSATHIVNTLDDFIEGCEIVQKLGDEVPDGVSYTSEQVAHYLGKAPFLTSETKGALEDTIRKSPYVLNTVLLFHSLGNAIATAKPYGEALYSGYQQTQAQLTGTYEKHSQHYAELPENSSLSDKAYYAMHAILTGPAHIDAMTKGQSELPMHGKQEAVRRAQAFADEVETLDEHVNIKSFLVKYPMLAADMARIVFKRVVTKDSIDQEALSAIKNLATATYDGMMTHGLDAMNNHVFHKFLCAVDDLEAALEIEPGILSESFEKAIDEYRAAFLTPLNIPSEQFMALSINEASYDARAARMPHGSSHAEYFDTRMNSTQKPDSSEADAMIKAREQSAREVAIDRALDLELMRLGNNDKFALKHASSMYRKDLRKTLRPVMQAKITGTGGFESRVFDLMYVEPTSDLSVFDKNNIEGSCRLDAMRAYVSRLEDYLKPTYAEQHGFLFDLFEDEDTHARKLARAKALRTLLDDPDLKPSAKIKAVEACMNQTAFQVDMQSCSPSALWIDVRAAIVWLLSCVGLCTAKTAGVMAFEQLARAADNTVLELQVFDELHAKDYRRLEAILKEVTLLEQYLTPNTDPAYIRPCKLFESKTTKCCKKAWLKQLREIANDQTISPSARIDEMQELMAQPIFKEEMMAYAPLESYFSFEAFKRGVVWLLSFVGLCPLPYGGLRPSGYKALVHAADDKISYSEQPLVKMGLFSEPAPLSGRNYTAETVFDSLGSASAA